MNNQENNYDHNKYLDRYINIHFCICKHNTTCSLCSEEEYDSESDSEFESSDKETITLDYKTDNNDKPNNLNNSYFSGNTFIFLGALATLGFTIYKYFRK